MKITNEERQALIALAENIISYSNEQPGLQELARIALAALTAEPVKVPDENLARQAYEKYVRSRYQYPMLERHPEGDGLRAGEYREIDRQREWEGWLLSWNACRAEVLRLNAALEGK